MVPKGAPQSKKKKEIKPKEKKELRQDRYTRLRTDHQKSDGTGRGETKNIMQGTMLKKSCKGEGKEKNCAQENFPKSVILPFIDEVYCGKF